MNEPAVGATMPPSSNDHPTIPPPPALALCLHLHERNEDIPLDRPEITIGRSPNCQIVIDDTLVSRKHARIIVTSEEAVVEDLNSANGVYVNGERILGSRQLAPGDRILIGREILQLIEVHEDTAPTGRSEAPTTESAQADPRATIVSVPAVAPPPSPTAAGISQQITARDNSAFELLGILADRARALGHGEDAEKILAERMSAVLRAARAGSVPTPQQCAQVGRHALGLAASTGKGVWVDYVVELYHLARRPWPAAIVDELYNLVRNVDAINLPHLRAYIQTLKASAASFGPAERFLLQRIDGVERLVALK
jgi:pSer/pThr/pTyr-binding forkhead associated (FHA) protein